MKLEQWQLILGARVDRFSVHFFDQAFSAPPALPNVVTATNIKNREDTLPSWHGALIYKPADNGTLYFTYGTSFNPSAETLDIISSFHQLQPKQREYRAGAQPHPGTWHQMVIARWRSDGERVPV